MIDASLVLEDLTHQYLAEASQAYLRLYNDGENHAGVAFAFASMHERLNRLLVYLNSRISRGVGGGHYTADESRQLMDLIEEIGNVRKTLARIDINMRVRDDYQIILDECDAFLVRTGGSAIPDDLESVEVDRYGAIFLTDVNLPKGVATERERPKLTLVAEGSYAHVHKYVDPVYGFTVAQKTAKKGLTLRELERFRAEFETTKELNFPNVVQVYAYDQAANSYTMEFCDTTLQDYIQRLNSKLSWTARKRIALQFLYGVNYLHRKGILHRDISRKNVLVRLYDEGAVQVKLSDLGLHKAPDSEFTRADTSMKGTIRDPALEHFKDFGFVNDVYSVGHVLLFIFTGRTALGGHKGDMQQVIDKCTDNDPTRRFQTVREVIAAVELLIDPKSAGTESTGAPA